VREHVLAEAQFTAGPQHAPELGERARRVGHGAEHEARNGGVEPRIVGGQPLGDAGEDLGPNVGARGGGARPLAQIRLRLHGHDLLDRGGIVREVAARTRADLDHPARQPGQQLVPMSAYLRRLINDHSRANTGWWTADGDIKHPLWRSRHHRTRECWRPNADTPRLFNSPWEALSDLAAVTRRAKALAAVYARGRIDYALRERVMLAVSRLNACSGCTFVHTRWAAQGGVTPGELDAIGLDDLGRLDRRSRAAVVYATARAETRFRSPPRPDVAAAVAAELTPAETEAVVSDRANDGVRQPDGQHSGSAARPPTAPAAPGRPVLSSQGVGVCAAARSALPGGARGGRARLRAREKHPRQLSRGRPALDVGAHRQDRRGGVPAVGRRRACRPSSTSMSSQLRPALDAAACRGRARSSSSVKPSSSRSSSSHRHVGRTPKAECRRLGGE
jgi:AhpD family alkylhydroperoxidase